MKQGVSMSQEPTSPKMTDKSNSPFGSFALNQLTSESKAVPPRQQYNPRPPGILQSGSATNAVLNLLASTPGRYMTTAQIIWGTGRTNKSVDWGLRMLRSMNLLDLRRDDKSARNWQYRLKPEPGAKP
jgi:hypothetical protein